mgnify:FL=1|tara:strand:- start:272 stop:589 length:318 start_codon:yes stop_codon:yes gene_type:complete
MKVKGKRVLITDDAVEFARTIRGQYIISQALVLAHKVLKGYEEEVDRLFAEGKKMEDIPNRYITRQEPSNRADMEYLLKAYPLYQIHNPEIWEILKEVEEEYESN